MENGLVHETFRDLTGAPTFVYDINSVTVDFLQEMIDKKYCITAAPKVDSGLDLDHQYGIFQVSGDKCHVRIPKWDNSRW